MKIGVTGASGFVGRALLHRLRREGRDFVPLVRKASGLPGERVVGEIDETTDWSGLLEDLDVIVHLASRVHKMADRAIDPLAEFRRVNRDGTAHLARQAAAQGIGRFIFISTVKVNGEATVEGRPYRAEDPPVPEAPYAISKLEAERAVVQISAASDMDFVIIRPPLVYGPAARGNFPSMVKWVRRGLPLPLGAATANRRSLVGIDNLVDLICACLVEPNAANQTFLVSDGRDLSTSDLLRLIGAAAGRKVKLAYVPIRVLRAAAKVVGKTGAADRLLGSLQVDISKTEEMLGWHPPVPVEEGLRRAVQAAE